jgi:hypothetical protein
MAVVRYRYRKTDPNVDIDHIRQRVGATPTNVGQSQGQLVDIDIDTAIDDIADLDEAMSKLGYTNIQGPGVTGTPGDAAEFVRRTGDTMTGNLVMSTGATVSGVPTATNPTEVINLAQLNATVISGRIWREAVLVKEQLLNGGAGGILQAELAYLAANLAAGDTFIIDDGAGGSETYTAVAGAPVGLQFQVGGSAAATQTNLVASINANSALWSAIETTGLDDYFAGAPAGQFVVYRTATSTAADRIYGVIAGGQAGVKVVEFATGDQDYVSAAGTESDLPAADPAAKRFGFGRLYANLISVETHLAVEDVTQWTWDEDDDTWRMTGGATSAGAPVHWGCGDIGGSATDRYLYPGFDDDLAQVDVIQWRVPRNGTIRNLRVRINAVGAAATNVTYTLRVNGVPTALAVTIAANVADGSNLANSVVVSAGDLVDIIITKAAALVGLKPRDVMASVEFTS